jgi:hypothetical protein
MLDDPALNWSIGEINQQLACLARLQKRLRTMLQVAIEAREDAERFAATRPVTSPSQLTRLEEVNCGSPA